MTKGTVNDHTFTRPVSNDVFNVRKILLIISGKWYYFLIALILAFVGSHLYIRWTFPTFLTSTTIMIEEEQTAPAMDLLEGFELRPGNQNLDNQILVLSSHKLIRQTLEELSFEINFYRKGIFNTVSFYPLEPLKIERGVGGLPYNSEFYMHYHSDDEFRLVSIGPGAKLDTIIGFGQYLNFGSGSFRINSQPELAEVYNSGKRIYFRFNDVETLTSLYQERMFVEAASRDGSIIRLSLEGTNKEKDKDFLDKLSGLFIQNNLDKKNTEANRIVDFIDAQLVDVTRSLTTTENELQEFRSRNRIMDVSAQAQQIIDQAAVLENERARLSLREDYYNYLDEYLSSEDNDETAMAPSTMGIEDPLLANLMQELAALQAEYFSSGVGERNPLQSQLELRIRNTKESIKETLQTIKLANQMAINENRNQINSLNADAARLPVKERELLGIERKFNLNNALYTFLDQRRAEAQIQKASNMPDYELVDEAISSLFPVAPYPIVIYLLAITVGLGLPLLILILVDVIRNKVTSEEELKQMTQLPIVGHIPHGRLSYYTLVLTEPQHRISEAFRSLRSRLEFINQDVECPVIVFTSSMPGEGKTFSAVNLASAYSLAGKKTLIVGMDLRRPTLSKSFGIEGELGLSTYLIGRNTLNQVIFKTDYENLSLIPSGPVPPNPGELASSDKVKDMFRTLRGKYDYILVDTAPIGTVADNYAVASIADTLLIMVRHDFTERRLLRSTLSDLHANGIKYPNIIINDISSSIYSYRYSYNYKYEYRQKNNKNTKNKWLGKNEKKPAAAIASE